MRSRRNRYPFIQRRSPLAQRLGYCDGTASNPQQSGCYPHPVPMKPHEMNFRGPCCVAGGSCFVHPLIKNFVGISIRWVCLRLQEGQTLNRWTCLQGLCQTGIVSCGRTRQNSTILADLVCDVGGLRGVSMCLNFTLEGLLTTLNSKLHHSTLRLLHPAFGNPPVFSALGSSRT